MTRIGSFAMDRQVQSLLTRQYRGLSDATTQLASETRVASYADLGSDAGRILGARSTLAQMAGQKRVNQRVDNTMALYQARLGEIDLSLSDLRKAVMDVLGGGDANVLSDQTAAAFRQFRASVTATEQGKPMFGGALTGSDGPLKAATLADTIGMTAATAFDDDGVRAVARLDGDTDVRYGIGISEFGGDFVEAFSTLAQLGSLPARPTDAQLAELAKAKSQIDAGLEQLRAADARNGNNQNRVEEIGVRAQDRENILRASDGEVEDVDLPALRVELTARQNALDASWSAYVMLKGMSLTDYLR